MTTRPESLRYRLVQARLIDDPVCDEERRSFARGLGVTPEHVTAVNVTEGRVELEEATADCDAVLVGGSGEFSVLDDIPWVRDYIDLLGAISGAETSMFASCFGFQGLVIALGGRVAAHAPYSELATHEVFLTEAGAADPLFRDMPATFYAQQGHKDSAMELPSGVTSLAASDVCPHQALRVPGTNIYATQFHPELTGETNRRRFERYFDVYVRTVGQAKAEEILGEFRPSPVANSLLGHFAAQLCLS